MMTRRTVASYLLVLIVIVLSSCAGARIKGTWTQVESKYIDDNGNSHTDYNGPQVKKIKVINQSHFSTLWQSATSNNSAGFNGGRYTFKKDIYTENYDFLIYPQGRNTSLHFKVSFKDGLMRFTPCNLDGDLLKSGYFEIWEKLN